MISAERGHTMTITSIILLVLFSVSNTWALGQVDIASKSLNEGDFADFADKVQIDIFYEVFCPHCITFAVNQLAPVVQTMSSYVDIKTYPFGNANITDDNGKVTFECQHGPTECYGNKLHACALLYLRHTKALLYNICLMNSTDGQGSDDESADRCGKSMNIHSEPIKACAKANIGTELLRYYGHESKKAHFKHVPYIMLWDSVFIGTDFKKAICDFLVFKPPSCEGE